ncbi:hypothetical protein EC991_001543 [Linnemannia zychae]|nr:hypothetical protein EC991_001543 [Linnemannia zychae]
MNVSEGVMAAIDPLTQHVYIPGAYSGRLMLDHDLMTKTSTSQFTPFTSSTLTGYNFVWNEFRGSFFLWGGQAPSVSSHFFEYKPRSVDSWAELHSNGIAPRPLSGSCMVSAYGGTKMLLFGGYSSDLSTFSKSLFILDVPSMTWSHESGPVTSENRAGMACSVSGDSLIIWGGYRNAAGEEDTIGLTPLVYNFLTRNWTTTFVPGSHHNALQQRDSQGSEASESGTDKPGSNNAAIIGGAAGGGALVLILLVVTLVVCRKRRGQRQQTQVPKEENLSQVQDPEKDLSPHVIDDDEDRFNFKEPVAPSTSQIVKDATSYNVAFDKTSHTSHTKQNQMPSSSARNSRIELEAALHRPSQSPHSIDPLPSPRSTISPSSTIYGVYAAPTLMNPSEPIRSMTSVSKHHIQRMQDHSMTQQQNQVGNGNSPHMNTIITDERGVPLGPQMSQRRPQDHSEGTRSNGERTLTTVEQLEVLHEELFSLNSEIGRLQSSLNQ